MKMRKSTQTFQVLAGFLERPGEWKYGYDMSRETGLKSGTLYPILMRLAERALLETRWEPVEAGRPPRHMYRLTPAGAEFARGLQLAGAIGLKLEPVIEGGAR
jgi:DNA-binding PadR family transcriptional regulator